MHALLAGFPWKSSLNAVALGNDPSFTVKDAPFSTSEENYSNPRIEAAHKLPFKLSVRPCATQVPRNTPIYSPNPKKKNHILKYVELG